MTVAMMLVPLLVLLTFANVVACLSAWRAARLAKQHAEWAEAAQVDARKCSHSAWHATRAAATHAKRSSGAPGSAWS